MELYRAIADYYDDIFPLDPSQADFIASRLPSGGRVLDSGCATGSLAFELASRGFRVLGIDLSPRLIASAVRKARSFGGAPGAPEFRLMDMTAAASSFPPASFDAVLCLGNTLPHLPGKEEIGACLGGFRRVLSPSGFLVVQIIDFEKAIQGGTGGLPAIDNAALRFERDYVGIESGKGFEFRTRLWIKPAPEPIRGSTRLYAVSKAELDALLERSGFRRREYSAGFSPGADPGNSTALVAVAS